MPVVGLQALRSIPCPFLLICITGAGPCTCISQATLSTDFWLDLSNRGTHSSLEGRRRGDGRVFLPFFVCFGQHLWQWLCLLHGPALAVQPLPQLQLFLATLVAQSIQWHWKLPLLSSRSCHKSWFLGFHLSLGIDDTIIYP